MTQKQKTIKYSYKIIRPIQKIYWFLFRPKTRGVKCLVENNGEFLLVKLNYAHKLWTLPGGKVNKNETFLEGAIREAKEEVGLDLINVEFIGSYDNRKDFKRDTVEVYLANGKDINIKIDPIEIKEAKWFNRESLPKDRVPSLNKIFNFYDEYKSRKSK